MENEKRLIDANALKGDFMFLRKMWSGTEITEAIDDAPTVDAVEVVHGEWIKCTPVDGVEFDLLRCSVCGKVIMCAKEAPRYCCGCGAKMDGDCNG